MASYPSSLPTFAPPGANLSSPTHSSQHILLNTELAAVCDTLGVNPQSTYATVAARLTAIEASGSGGSPAGSDSFVQYNHLGAFGGEAAFTYVDSTNTLSVPNLILSGDLSDGVNTVTVAELDGAVTMSTNSNIVSISGLTYVSTSFVKMTGANTFALDTNSYPTIAQALLIDQTTPQTVINGRPIFDQGIRTNNLININLNTVNGPTVITGTAMRVQAADSTSTRIAMSTFGTGVSGAFACRGARNTAAAPQAAQNNDSLVALEGWGYGATGFSAASRVAVRGFAAETWTDSTQATYATIETTPAATIVPVERLRVLSTGVVKLNSYTTNGFVKFTGSDGTLGVDTAAYLSLDQTTPQTIANGKPIMQGIQFATSPTVGSFAEGKLYYDTDWKGLSCNMDTDVNLQIGQEELRRIYNNTGSQIDDGSAVYTNGVYVSAFPYVATVALARANSESTSQVLGLATQNIPTGEYGFITVRGHVNGLNTDVAGWANGDVLYLDATTPGALTNVAPTDPNLQVRIGRLIYKHASNGTINVRLIPFYTLSTLGDVNISTPSTDQVLKYNGAVWVNGSAVTSGAGAGIEFFHATPVITARTSPTGLSQDGTAGNGIQINSLSKTPVTTAEQSQVGSASADTRAFTAWLYDTALARTTIDSGLWDFTTYALVSSVAGTTTSISRAIYQVVPGTGTLTITGIAANTRLAKLTTAQMTGTYYVPSATNTTASYIQATSGTNKGIYQITSAVYHFTATEATAAVGDTYTNNGQTFTVVETAAGGTDLYATGTGAPAASGNLVRATGAGTDPIVFSAVNTTTAAMITIRTGYANESTITYNIWNRLFSSSPVTITSTSALQYDTTVAAPAFTVAATDKLGQIGFVTSTGARSVTTYYDGTARNSHFSTPLVTLHNNLAGLNGGTSNQYYHLTSDEYAGTGVGTGNMARLTSAALVTPNIGTPSAGTLTNCTGLPITGLVAATGGDKDKYLHSNSGTGAVEWTAVSSVSGTRGLFDNADLSTGVLTITHSLGLSTPYALLLVIVDNAQKQIIPDEVTFLTNTITVDLTSYGTLTGDWGYYYI